MANVSGTAQLDIPKLRRAVAENHYVITAHAKQRMGTRRVSDQDIKRVITTGDVVEQHLDAGPFPKALFMAKVRDVPLYVSCAFDGRFAHVVTVHWYDPSIWSDPWTRRRS